MGNFVNLSAAIVSVLQGIQQEGANAFVQVLDYPSTEFSGLPSATVVPSDSESDYQTVYSNFRQYLFFVDLYTSMEVEGEGPAVAFAQLRELVDTVLNAYDQSSTLSGACEILRPSPSAWSVIGTGAGVLLSARVTLTCGLSVESNNG